MLFSNLIKTHILENVQPVNKIFIRNPLNWSKHLDLVLDTVYCSNGKKGSPEEKGGGDGEVHVLGLHQIHVINYVITNINISR